MSVTSAKLSTGDRQVDVFDINSAKPTTTLKPIKHTSSYDFVKSIRVNLTSSETRGYTSFLIPFDASLDSAISALLQRHVHWSFENLQLEAISASPMGSSSGAMQICHIPDPQNVDFDSTSTDANITKAVAQSGSFALRPRDTITKDITPAGVKFAAAGAEPRLHSFGALAGIVRDSCSAGDVCTFLITLRGTVNFDTPTFNNGGSSVVSTDVGLKFKTKKDTTLVFELDKFIPTRQVKIRTMDPMRMLINKYINGAKIKMHAETNNFEGVIEGKELTVDMKKRLERNAMSDIFPDAVPIRAVATYKVNRYTRIAE